MLMGRGGGGGEVGGGRGEGGGVLDDAKVLGIELTSQTWWLLCIAWLAQLVRASDS